MSTRGDDPGAEKSSGEMNPINTTIIDVESKLSEKENDSPSAHIDPAAEKRLLWKLDLTIFPILYIVYMMSFLDRINISNARIQGLPKDIDLSGNRFNIALFVYFIPYILLEVPSNMLIRRVRPSWYLGGLMFCWGIINMCMGFIKTYEALVVLRFFLGVFEAGVLPGIIYLTSMYYKRHEYQTRMSFLFSSTLVGGAFGGLLAYGIAHLDGQKGYAAWRWIFIIEGAITAVIALVSIFLIVDWPEQCQFLSTSEKDLLKRRLAADGNETCRMDNLNGFAYKLIFSDYKIWLGSLIYMGIGTTGYATTFFMPTILLEFQWTAASAQVHTIPVYVVSAAGMLLAAWASDRLKQRYVFILLGSIIATIGYGILLGQAGLSRDTKYAAVFLICLGGYIATPIALAWLANNVSGHWKRSFGSGLQITLGNIAGIIGANIFLTTEQPRYPTGYGTAFGMLWMGTLAATAMYFLMRRENLKRDAGERDSRLNQPVEEVSNMGDHHPSFRFTL
ncbi:major facilitator superfamily domain-containing protein [Diplogelasinospora grovesii]|uniref:Major facilitator superfamily domain-containing protein n=1 Tax=Diplogelasinospora grovesii TaxID=303347 RepID=A0AAN6NAJ4_9PEZI|nr:major facilitator superfamily domain-containing protein [Diplogelasinospora grovesii]